MVSWINIRLWFACTRVLCVVCCVLFARAGACVRGRVCVCTSAYVCVRAAVNNIRYVHIRGELLQIMRRFLTVNGLHHHTAPYIYTHWLHWNQCMHSSRMSGANLCSWLDFIHRNNNYTPISTDPKCEPTEPNSCIGYSRKPALFINHWFARNSVKDVDLEWPIKIIFSLYHLPQRSCNGPTDCVPNCLKLN